MVQKSYLKGFTGVDQLTLNPLRKSSEQRRKRKRSDERKKNCKKKPIHQIKKQTHLLQKRLDLTDDVMDTRMRSFTYYSAVNGCLKDCSLPVVMMHADSINDLYIEIFL